MNRIDILLSQEEKSLIQSNLIKVIRVKIKY
jgi:hypothetical protein